MSSSLVSSITIDDILLASSEGSGEGGGDNEENSSEEQNEEDDEQDDDLKEQQKEGNVEKPIDGAIPTELPQAAVQSVTCNEGEAINPETGKCEKTELEEIGDEICDNSIDDDLDKEVDESECEPPDEKSTAGTGTQTGVPSFAPTSMLPLDPFLTSSSPLPGSGTEGTSEATETIRKEGMMMPPTTTTTPPPSSQGTPTTVYTFNSMLGRVCTAADNS